MTDDSETLTEREEIEALLPWYATGTLDAPSRARVDRYLDRHPEVRHQFALIDEDRDASRLANEAIPPPRTLSADRILERARGAKQPLAATPAWAGALEAIRDFLSAPTAMGVRWATAAAIVVMLAQGMLIGGLMRGNSPGGYETASGGVERSTDGVRVLVRFHKDARLEAIAQALAGLDMRIVDGPKPGELFVVRIADAAATETEKSARIARLRELTALVSVVLPMGP